MEKHLFLDRDGVIIHDVGYLSRIDQISFVDGIYDLIRRAVQKGYKITVITNQSGISRGYFSEDQFKTIMDHIIAQLCKNIEILTHEDIDYYFCPHLPENKCSCRKPAAGLFIACQENASREIDWKNSIMIGDKTTDLIAATRIGIKNNYLLSDADYFLANLSSHQLRLNFRKINTLDEIQL